MTMGSPADGEPELGLASGAIELAVDLRVYRLAAIKKAAYRFADRFTAVLGSPENDRLPLSLRFKANVPETAAKEITRQFFQELLDQELREQVAEETSALRTLILAQAFSNVDLIKRGE